MTLSDIEQIPGETLTASIVAQVLDCDPHYIRVQAHIDPSKLGFPAIVYGKRVSIPKAGFIHFMRYGNAPVEFAANQ